MRGWLYAALTAALALALVAGRAPGAERVALELFDGAKVEGEALKMDARFVHLSVGGAVLTLARGDIQQMTVLDGEPEGPADVRQAGLYHVGTGVVKSLSAFSEEFGPAVVTVKTARGTGTGWFCDPQGYVVTNAHVIANEQSVSVTAFVREGNRFETKVYQRVRIVALDEDVDLALLKIEEDLDMRPAQLYLGDSASVKEGDVIFTIGNPMGLERSVSQGTVSRANRLQGGRLFIQSTTPIAPGNSGGPLFNERGEVVGVVNMGYIFLDGLGFAIPSRYVKEFLDNVEAYAFDPSNPNTGFKYMEAPLTATDGSLVFDRSEFVRVGGGVSCLTLADMSGDGVPEILFVNNTKGELGVLSRRTSPEPTERAHDFEDINRLPDSERFELATHAVSNRIFALAVADLSGDGRPDVVFHGDLDGLAVLEQEAEGGFGPPRRIGQVDIARRADALRVADLNGDGRQDILALGRGGFHVFRKGAEREYYPLDAAYRDRISSFHLRDVNGNGRLDIVFFAADRQYAAHVLAQDEAGGFMAADMVPSHLSGPATPFAGGEDGLRFLALDKGQNRVRELELAFEETPGETGIIRPAVRAIALETDAGGPVAVELADLSGDGRLEIVTANRAKNEFLVFERAGDGFALQRSPAPKGLSGLKVHQTEDGRAALFCYSEEDKIFGVSRLRDGGVSFPRPINTEGVVQFLWMGKVDGDRPSLVWVERVDRDFVLRMAPADALAERAYDGQSGSISLDVQSLVFSHGGEPHSPNLSHRPTDLAFADFNGDGIADLVVFWAFSGRESLFLGQGEGRYEAVIASQDFLDSQNGSPLMVADIDGDGREDVLLVQPRFVRVLRVDDKKKLYVERQFNWPFDPVGRLTPYPGGDAPRFLATGGAMAKVVQFDTEAGGFGVVATLDMAGLGAGEAQVGDLDGSGRPDVLLASGNALRLLYNADRRAALRPRVVFDASLDNFAYWNVKAADLTGDGRDEAMLFDSKRAVFEICRVGENGALAPVLRHRLFERSVHQRLGTDSLEIPQEMAFGDVDGNGRADLVFVLQDRIAIYLQRDAEPR